MVDLYEGVGAGKPFSVRPSAPVADDRPVVRLASVIVCLVSPSFLSAASFTCRPGKRRFQSLAECFRFGKLRIQAQRLVDIIQRLVHLVQSVVTNCDVVSSAGRDAVELNRTLQERDGFLVKLHFEQERSQLKSQITFFTDRK